MGEITVTRIETEYDREGNVVGAHEVPVEQSRRCPACGERRIRKIRG